MKKIMKDLDLHPCYAHLDLWYNVRDYENCQQVRFYTHCKRGNKYHRTGELFEIPIRIYDAHSSLRKRGISPNSKPNMRREIRICYNGKTVHLSCSRLVFKIGWTFPIPDPRREVVDHIDKDTTNDRRNNLRPQSAKENVNTPESRAARLRNRMKGCILAKGRSNAQRHEIKAHRKRVLKLTGHMPSFEDAIRDLGLAPLSAPEGATIAVTLAGKTNEAPIPEHSSPARRSATLDTSRTRSLSEAVGGAFDPFDHHDPDYDEHWLENNIDNPTYPDND